MRNTEESHRLTESVYRGLSENFNPGVRQILICGKVYHKALLGLTSAARAYTESLLKVGSAARSSCKGGTEDIGEAIYQIAEINKEIQSRIEDNTKSLFSELILPLEQKIESEFKRSSSQYKKYSNGHKAVWAPYAKAQESLKRFRKKSKNKMVFDNEKEAQYYKALNTCQEKLDEYRVNGLKLALLEERKRHCFLLDRLNTLANMYANHHKQSADSLLSGLPHWKQLAMKPHILPPESERLLMLPDEDGRFEMINGGIHRNGYLSDETRSLGSPYRRSQSVHDVYRRPLGPADYSSSDYTRTLPGTRHMNVPPPPPTQGLQVRAVYTHVEETDTKLSFLEGDVINIIGDKSTEGWQYGLNTRSGKYGWFPLSFTEPLNIPLPREPAPMLNSRVKSMGDLLDSRSLSEQGGGIFMDQDMPGNIRRPKSLYEGSGATLPNPSSQSVYQTGWTGPSCNIQGSYSLPRHVSGHGSYFSSDMDHLYQFLPYDRQPQTTGPSEPSGTYSCLEQMPPPAPTDHMTSSAPSPPLPPPPPPPPPPPSTAMPAITPVKAATTSMPKPPVTSTSANSLTVFSPNMILESPVLKRKASMRQTNSGNSSSSAYTSSVSSIPPAPPIPSATSAQNNSSTFTTLSQNKDTGMPGYGTPLRQQQSNPPPPPPPTGRPTGQPPMPPNGGSIPAIDYGTEEEDSNFTRNPSFASVSLRKTVTNDRSSPRIN